MNIYKKIKKQNGEKFAQALRKEAPAAMETEEIIDIVKYAGRDPNDVAKISSAIHSFLIQDEDVKKTPECPIALLDKAGYDAYIVTDRKSQDAISVYFEPDEKLCTFGTPRYKNYNIINAVKKNVDDIKRKDFKNPKREDEYGTSVISIQVRNGFVSIKNRYNHKVPNCDATFGNDLDSIIPGLKDSVEYKFGIKIGKKSSAPDGFMIAQNKLFKVVQEINGIYYGDTAILKNGEIIDMGEDEYLYEYFIFDLKSKTLRKFDNDIQDSFADDFNKYYGGLNSLRVDKYGNLCDGNDVLFGVERWK